MCWEKWYAIKIFERDSKVLEKLKIDEENTKWEIVEFNHINNIDIRLYGCATHIIGNILFLFGGICNEEETDNILYYNFDDNILDKEESHMELCEYFKENKLYPIDDKLIQISDGKYLGTYIHLSK